ncbi:myo-inositol-1(or 4)-monophosphatase [Monaibacterium marinum]|uniref:Inositol-1-monophosphatase n=1 Tax=Pontivivens marinum TaxID=1690039 RepID=A0A2C9CV56_9RHOB|nr:inositol monophosphatase family protein [Monaibacterium marinum]SOH95138.1 myo-inositol-1(or 4)-monophosphatase [Monaibacterium marinum]
MTDPIAARHLFACQIAREAGAVARTLFENRDILRVEAKETPQDVVSRADREVEALVRDRIAASFPDDGIVGEEHDAKSGTSGFTWVIDPIDGTMPFLSGLPSWCIAIALLQGAQTVAAATFVPMQDQLFDARLGGGFRCDGAPVMVSDSLDLTGAMTAIGASHRSPAAHVAGVIGRLIGAGGAFYRSGSGALMLADVAMGRLAGYYEPHMYAWDCLGGLLMVQEAGGWIEGVDMDQMLASGGRVLAAAPCVYDPLRGIIDAG